MHSQRESYHLQGDKNAFFGTNISWVSQWLVVFKGSEYINGYIPSISGIKISQWKLDN